MTNNRYSRAVRLASLFLCLLMAFALFAGCKGKDTKSSSTQSKAEEVSSAPPTEVLDSWQDKEDPNIPATKDLGGFEMTFALPNGAESLLIPKEGDSTEGDLMLEALRKTQEAYNCTISAVTVQNADWGGEVMTNLLSGDMYANVLMPCVHECGQFVSARLCADYMDGQIHEFIHMEEPWWNDTMAYASNVLGSVYAGACNIQSMADITYILFFNKRILSEIGYTDKDLYQMWRDKTWTWDKFREIAKKGVKDLNNDGKMDETDQWGFTAPGYDSACSFLSSANLASIVTENGMNPTFNFNTPFALTTLTTLNDMYTADGFYCMSATSRDAEGRIKSQVIFSEGRALFTSYQMIFCTGKMMRDMDDETGLMPIPLGPTEDGGWQKDYAARVDHNFRLCLIPATNMELSNTALVLESIAFNYWKIINQKTEAYGAMYLKDDDSAEMVMDVYNWSHFEIEQFMYSINGGVYNQNVLGKIGKCTSVPAFDVAGEISAVAEVSQGIIDTYFNGN